MNEIRELIAGLRNLESAGSEEVALSGRDLARLLGFAENALAVAEKANILLANAFSMPDDERGIRFLSEDGVRLQWALREMGFGEEPSMPV